MVLTAKILIIAGVLVLDVGLFLFLLRLMFKKGLGYKLTGVLVVIAALILGAGAFFHLKYADTASAPSTVAAQATSALPSKKIISDIKRLFHKTPAEIKKILGRPDAPVAPFQGGDHKLELKSGKRVPTTVGMYFGGTVQVNYLNGLAGYIKIIPRGQTYSYPGDSEKLLSTYGIPVIKTPARVTPFSVDWENTIPGIYKLQFNTTDNRINEIAIVFIGTEAPK